MLSDSRIRQVQAGSQQGCCPDAPLWLPCGKVVANGGQHLCKVVLHTGACSVRHEFVTAMPARRKSWKLCLTACRTCVTQNLLSASDLYQPPHAQAWALRPYCCKRNGLATQAQRCDTAEMRVLACCPPFVGRPVTYLTFVCNCCVLHNHLQPQSRAAHQQAAHRGTQWSD